MFRISASRALRSPIEMDKPKNSPRLKIVQLLVLCRIRLCGSDPVTRYWRCCGHLHAGTAVAPLWLTLIATLDEGRQSGLRSRIVDH
jgi:hypothetical protein